MTKKEKVDFTNRMIEQIYDLEYAVQQMQHVIDTLQPLINNANTEIDKLSENIKGLVH